MSASKTENQDAPRWRRLTGDQRRRQIVSVARELFAERPYPEVSTTQIAERAGVSHGLLTYHFGSKRKLYLEVVRATLWIPTQIPSPLEVDPDVDDALDTMCEWWLTEVERNREMWLSVLGARGLGSDDDVAAMLDEYEERSRADIVSYVTARDPRTASPEMFAIVAAWQGLAEATTVQWLARARITRPQAKFLILEGLRRLLKLERGLAGEGLTQAA